MPAGFGVVDLVAFIPMQAVEQSRRALRRTAKSHRIPGICEWPELDP
jgi:hypothetical protein